MARRTVPFLLCFVAFSPTGHAQLKDWRFEGRFHGHLTHHPDRGEQLFVRRSRILADGFFLPKTSTRFQYDFTRRVTMDLWASFHPSQHLEIRAGRSWLPFVGDYTESPFFLDMIDFPAAARLFPAREQGVFALGKFKSADYSVSVVRGSGFDADPNRWKDTFGYVRSPLFNGRLTLGFGHYQGRDGARAVLETKRRTTADFIAEVHRLVTLKGSYIIAKDGEVKSGGWWGRGVVHVTKKVDLVTEVDHFNTGPNRIRYLTWGGTYHFPWGLTRLKFNHRRFFRPRPVNEFKIQLQVLLEARWRSGRKHQGR